MGASNTAGMPAPQPPPPVARERSQERSGEHGSAQPPVASPAHAPVSPVGDIQRMVADALAPLLTVTQELKSVRTLRVGVSQRESDVTASE